MEFLEKHLLTKLQETCDHLEVMNQNQASLGFLLRSRKIHLGGCFAFFCNDGILELFTLNARILGIELNQYDFGVYQERILMLQTDKVVPMKIGL